MAPVEVKTHPGMQVLKDPRTPADLAGELFGQTVFVIGNPSIAGGEINFGKPNTTGPLPAYVSPSNNTSLTGEPVQPPMTRRQFLKTSGTALGALALAPLIRSPNSLPTSPTKKPSESRLISDPPLGHYLESGNIDNLKQFIPEVAHITDDKLSLFLSPDIPFEVWTGANTGDDSDPSSIMIDAFTKASAISSVSQAQGYPLTLFENLLGKVEKSGNLKKLSNNMLGITNYDTAWFISDEARLDQKTANRITSGHITVDRLLFDDLGNLIIIARKSMKPLVVRKKVKKFLFGERDILEVNESASDDKHELTFAVKVKIKDLPANVWGGKYDNSQSLLDCQAVLTGNWLERMRQTKNLLLRREIVAWPRDRRDIFWDTQSFGGVNISNKISAAVDEEPTFKWKIDGHLATSVFYNPERYDFDHPPMDDFHTRALVSGALVKIPVGAKLFLHGLQRRPNGEFIALVEAKKNETYAPGDLPELLYSSVIDFRDRYGGKFFWVSHKDLQSPVVKVKK